MLCLVVSCESHTEELVRFLPLNVSVSEAETAEHYNLSVIAVLHSDSYSLLVIYIHTDPDTVLAAADLHPLSILCRPPSDSWGDSVCREVGKNTKLLLIISFFLTFSFNLISRITGSSTAKQTLSKTQAQYGKF